MKRVVLSLIGTVAGLVALLSFKTTGSPVTSGPLPEAALPNQPGATAPSRDATGGSGATGAAAGGAANGKNAKVVGDAVQTRYGVVQVQLTRSGSRIAAVSFVQLTSFDPRSAQINAQAGPILLDETLAAQSSNIDTVSGATFTSEGYLQSLQSALDKAGLR